MNNGNVNEFVDGLYRGNECWFTFQGNKYFIQGWWNNGKATLVLDDCSNTKSKDYLWTNTSENMSTNVEAFLNAPLWGNKTFWEAECEMTWID